MVLTMISKNIMDLIGVHKRDERRETHRKWKEEKKTASTTHRYIGYYAKCAMYTTQVWHVCLHFFCFRVRLLNGSSFKPIQHRYITHRHYTHFFFCSLTFSLLSAHSRSSWCWYIYFFCLLSAILHQTLEQEMHHFHL